MGVLSFAKISGHDMSRTVWIRFRAQLDRRHDLRDHQLVREIMMIAFSEETTGPYSRNTREPRSSSFVNQRPMVRAGVATLLVRDARDRGSACATGN